MTEMLFYHLEKVSLEHVLPNLLDKCLERGWRVVVQASSQERVDALNLMLWTYQEQSFLPHGTASDGNSQHQPIFLTDKDENPNQATVRFYVDAAKINEVSDYNRVIYLFDGNDNQALQQAREQWKAAKQAGHDITYWQQNDQGRWEKSV